MEKFLGLFIGKEVILGCEATVKKGKTKITNLKAKGITSSYGKELEIEIRKFLKEGRFKSKNLALSLNDEDVIVRVSDYPKMPEDDLKKIILDEVSSYKIITEDYPVLNLFKLKDLENRSRYLVVVSPRKRIEEKIKFFSKLGFIIKNINIQSISAFRGCKIFYKNIFSGSGVFLFLGDNKTTLIYYYDGDPLLFRDFDIGVKEAEENFINFRNEISNTISYFSREEKKAIEKLIVVGLTSDLKEISSKINEFTGIETIPLQAVGNRESYFSLPIGLSLFNLEDKLKINLIPKDILEKGKDIFKLFILTLFSIVLAFLILFLSYYLITSIKITQVELKTTTDYLKNIEKSLNELKGIEKKYQEVNQKYNELIKVIDQFKSINGYKTVNKIISLKPKDITVLKISNIDEKSFNLLINSESLSSIYIYKENLINGGFKEVSIKFISRDSKGFYNSTIELKGE